MKIIESIAQWQQTRKTIAAEKTIGFVPTMGNLHVGHASLLEKARQENDIVVLSIFVNPTQFNNAEDLKNYPRTFAADCELAEQLNIDFVLAPQCTELYADQYNYQINEKNISLLMEGKHRPGHFNGMLTVVTKLLLLVKAHKAYFGEKDFQQLQLVKGLVNALFIDTEIVGCETVRLPSGLPYSSRNQRLSEQQKKVADLFPKFLHNSKLSCEQVKENLIANGFTVDYVEEHENRRFAAVKIGEVRLIDNIMKDE